MTTIGIAKIETVLRRKQAHCTALAMVWQCKLVSGVWLRAKETEISAAL